MAVGFIESITGSSSASFTGLSIPAGSVAGDLVIMVIQTSTVTTFSPSGTVTWTQLGTTQNWASGTRSSAVFYKILNGVGDTAGQINFGGTVAFNRVSALYRGVKASTPFESFTFNVDSDASSTSTPASSLVTTTKARAVVIAHAVGQALTNASITAAGFISRGSDASNGNSAVLDRGPDYEAGTIGSWSFSLASAAQHAAWSIALKEDPNKKVPVFESALTGLTASGGATSLTVTYGPAQNGDLAIVELVLVSSTETINSVPSGFTLIEETLSGVCRQYTYWRIHDGTVNGVFGFSGTVYARYVRNRFTSGSPFPVFSVSENTGSSSTVTFPAVTPVVDGLVTYVGGSAIASNAATNSASLPTGGFETHDTGSAGTSATLHLYGGTQNIAVEGVPTSTFNSTLTNARDWTAQTIVLENSPEVLDSLAASSDALTLAVVPEKWLIGELTPDALVTVVNMTGTVSDIQNDPLVGGDSTYLAPA